MNDEYLQHWGLSKGQQAKNHKYIARVKQGNAFRYFYTQEEYQAFLHPEQAKQILDKGVSESKEVAKSSASKAANEAKGVVNSAKSKVESAANNVLQKAIDNTKPGSEIQNFLKKAEESRIANRTREVADKVNSILNTTLNDVSKITTKNVSEGIKKVNAVKHDVNKLANNVATSMNTAKDQVEDTVRNTADSVNNAVNTARENVNNAVNTVKDTANNISSNARSAVNDTGNKLSEVADNADEIADKFVDEFKKTYDDAVDKFRNATDVEYSYNREATHSDTADEPRPQTVADLKYKTTEMTSEEDMLAINKDNYNKGLAFQENCTMCTAAFDLRKRGYDVEADKIASSGYSVYDISDWYDDDGKIVDDALANMEYYPSANLGSIAYARKVTNNLSEKLDTEEDGARGHFRIGYASGGGHDVAWEKIDGKVTIYDCQVGESYSLDDFVKKYSNYVNSWTYYRTDQYEVNDNMVKACVQNKKGSSMTPLNSETSESQASSSTTNKTTETSNTSKTTSTSSSSNIDKIDHSSDGTKVSLSNTESDSLTKMVENKYNVKNVKNVSVYQAADGTFTYYVEDENGNVYTFKGHN